MLYVVDLYDDNGGVDCIPEFFGSRETAEAAGRKEVARVKALLDKIDAGEAIELNPWDFATRFEVRECEEDN